MLLFTSPTDQDKMKRKIQSMLKYQVLNQCNCFIIKLLKLQAWQHQIVSSQEELEELRNQNAEEGILVDPKEMVHLVKYVKVEGKVLKIWECGICKEINDFLFSSFINV